MSTGVLPIQMQKIVHITIICCSASNYQLQLQRVLRRRRLWKSKSLRQWQQRSQFSYYASVCSKIKVAEGQIAINVSDLILSPNRTWETVARQQHQQKKAHTHID